MQEVNSSLVFREGIAACLHLPQHDGQQDRLLSMQQWGRRSMWWDAKKEYCYECILWWSKGLIHLGCTRTSETVSRCWFGKVQVFLEYCVRPSSPEDASGYGGISQGQKHSWLVPEEPLPRGHYKWPLWTGHVSGCDPIELEEKSCGRGTGDGMWSPYIVHVNFTPFSTPPQQNYTPRKQEDNGEERILPTQQRWASGTMSLPSVHIVLVLLMQQPVDLHH